MTREEADKLIAEIEAQVEKKPAWTPKKGDYVQAKRLGRWSDEHFVYDIMIEKNLHRVKDEDLYFHFDEVRPYHIDPLGIEWNGGECPVGDNNIVLLKYRNGTYGSNRAQLFTWAHEGHDHDIIKFWVIKE